MDILTNPVYRGHLKHKEHTLQTAFRLKEEKIMGKFQNIYTMMTTKHI